MTKIAIIGGGASGLACAIELLHNVKDKSQVEITILEKQPNEEDEIIIKCENINPNIINLLSNIKFASVIVVVVVLCG